MEIISAVAAGKFVSPYYDSMIAQVVVHAEDRNAAIAKLLEYLGRAKISGICTNIPLLIRILQDQVFVDGIYDTGYLPELLKRTDVESLVNEIEASAGPASGGIDAASISIDDSDELRVVSPSTAIFYTTPTPTSPEYVSVGDQIEINQTMCQLEAFKIFTPLCLQDFNGDSVLYPDTQRYEVTRINMSNTQQVNQGDLLFVVKPLAAEA